MKDFLFLYFSHLPGPNYFFKSIENSGYSCDYVTEKNIFDFKIENEYKAVICYLHEPYEILNKVNEILLSPFLKNSFFVQHDDTDFSNVMQYYKRQPNLVFQREITNNSINHFNVKVVPMHFAFPSIFDDSIEVKDIDVSFVGQRTNYRRDYFVQTILDLSRNSLSNLKWHINYDVNGTRNHEQFVNIANRSKISLHFFGNSQDSIRIWELASCKTCLFIPENNLLSLSDDHMPLRNCVKYDPNLSDLKHKIEYFLENDRYITQSSLLFDEYNNEHTPEKCFVNYYDNLFKNCNVTKLQCKPLDNYDCYKQYFNHHANK